MTFSFTYNKMPPLYYFCQVYEEQKNHLLKIELMGKYCLTQFLITLKYQHIALLTQTAFQIYYEGSLYLNDLYLKDLVFQYQKGKMPWGRGCKFDYFSVFPVQVQLCSRKATQMKHLQMLILFTQASNHLKTSGIHAEHRKHFFFLTSYSFTKV